MKHIHWAVVALTVTTGCIGASTDEQGEEQAEQADLGVNEAAVDSSLSGLAAWADRTDLRIGAIKSDGAGNTVYLAQDAANDEQWLLVKLDPYGKEVMRRVMPNAMMSLGVGNDGSMALVGSDHPTDVRDFGCGPKQGLFVVKLAADGSCLWHDVISGTNVSVPRVDIADNGDVVIGGDTFGPTDFGGGMQDYDSQLAVVRYDADGHFKWSRRFGEARAGRRRSMQGVNGLALDAAGKVYLGGYHYATIDFGGGTMSSSMQGVPPGTAFLAVLDENGNYVRQGSYGGSSQVLSLDVRADGRAVIAGTYNGAISFGDKALSSGSLDVFIAVMNTDGTTRWAKKLYGSQSVDLGGVGIDANGYVSIAGATSVFSNTTGTWNVGPNHLTLGPHDAWAARFTPGTGATKWAKTWSASTTPDGYSYGFVMLNSAVVAQNNGRLLIAGHYAGKVDFGRGKVIDGHGDFVTRIYP